MAAGGAVGALARHAAGDATTLFPWPTLLVNVSGCLALGLVAARWAGVEWVRLLVGVGFLGAYTTMSAFAVQTDVLVRDGHALVAAGYVGLSVVGGIGACLLGRAAA